MKKFVMSLICLLIFSSAGYCEKEVPQNKAIDNAATYYLTAIELLRFPDDENIESQIEVIIERGWKEKNKDIEQLLIANAEIFSELNKGAILQKCNFNDNPLSSYSIDSSDFRRISRMLLVKGRYLEKQKQIGDAITIQLNSLTIARHLSQEKDLYYKVLSLTLEEDNLELIEQYINSTDITPELCLKISNFLDEYLKNRFSATEMVENEKEKFMFYMKNADNVINNDSKISKEFDEKKRKAMVEFGDELLKKTKKLSDEYYGFYMQAAETGSSEDLTLAVGKFLKLKKDTVSPGAKFAMVAKMGFFYLTGNNAKYTGEMCNSIGKLLLVMCLNNFDMAIKSYHDNGRDLEKIKSLAASKIGLETM